MYSIQLYDSCNECQTPAGVIITKHDEESREMWDVDHLPEMPDDGYGGHYIPVLDPAVLVAKVREWGGPDVNDDYDADGFVQDSIPECFRDAVWATYNARFSSKEGGQ